MRDLGNASFFQWLKNIYASLPLVCGICGRFFIQLARCRESQGTTRHFEYTKSFDKPTLYPKILRVGKIPTCRRRRHHAIKPCPFPFKFFSIRYTTSGSTLFFLGSPCPSRGLGHSVQHWRLLRLGSYGSLCLVSQLIESEYGFSR